MALIQYLNVITGLIYDGKTYKQVSKYLESQCGLSTGISEANIRLFCKENNVKYRTVLPKDTVDSLVSDAVAEVNILFILLVGNLFILNTPRVCHSSVD